MTHKSLVWNKIFIFIEAVVLYYCIYIEALGLLNTGESLSIIKKLGNGALYESILLILLIAFLNRFPIVPKKTKFYEIFFSVIFTAFLIAGDCLKANNSLYCLYVTRRKAILVVFVALGLSVFMLHLFEAFRFAFNKINEYIRIKWNPADLSKSEKKYKRLLANFFNEWLEKNLFIASFVFLMICWLPLAILRYPAGVEYDAYQQILQFLGYAEMTAHHPPASTALMGSFVWLGIKLFHAPSVGLFLFVLFQTTIAALVFAYSVKTLKDLGVRKLFTYTTIVFYGIIPVYANYMTAAVKDAMYSIFVMLLIALLARELFLEKDGRCVKRKIGIGFTALGVCLLRKNGVYIIYALIVVFVLWMLFTRTKKQYFSLVISLLLVVAANSAYHSVLLPGLGIEEGSIKEALSIPFQQTARYVKEYPDEVTEEEKEAISAVLDYEHLAEKYDPGLSDPVKGTYTGNEAALKPYFKVWFQMFLKHPRVYIEATLNNCYQFFYVNQPGMQWSGIYIGTWNLNENLQFDTTGADRIGNILRNGIYKISSQPILALLCSSGFHFWILIYCMFAALRCRHGKILLFLLPSLIGILVCAASPTYYNNGLRFAVPVICANPFVISVILQKIGCKNVSYDEVMQMSDLCL